MTENRYKTMLENYRKEETQFYYMTLLENILLSMFTYDNLPNGLTGEYIEKSLLRYGNVLLTKVSDTEYYGNYVVYQGALDNNGIMEQGFTTTRNGMQTDTKPLYYKKSLEYKDNSNVLIFNNSEHLPTFDICRISELLTEVYISMRNNVINTRILPIPVARNSKMKDMIDNILNKLHSGKTEAIVNDLSSNDAMNILLNKADVKSTFDIPVLNLTQPNNVELLQNLTKFYDDIIRIFCTTYGISINGTGKMAQQNNIELQGYELFSKIIPCDMLNCRKTGIEIFNSIYGTDVEVTFSDAWKHLLSDNENVSHETMENDNENVSHETIENENGGEDNVN